MDNPLLDSSAPPAQQAIGTPPSLTFGNTPTGPEKFQAPKLNNLGDLLDYQRAAMQEAIFHKGTSDANRAALRSAVAKIPDEVSLGAAWAGMPLTEFYKIGAQNYDKLPPPMRGVYDAILDTGTDPLTLETADTGTLGKFAARYGGKLLSALDKTHLPVWGPNIVTDISHAATRLLNFGGEAINKLGRGPASEAIGMLNRHRAESRELFRRLKEIDAKTMEGLTKSQTSAVQKILHGQLPPELEARVLQDPAIAKAVAGRKELTDALVRMQAAPGSDLEERLGGEKPNLFRFQSTPGEPEISPRGGTFFARNEPEHSFKEEEGLGGQHLIPRVAAAKNPLRPEFQNQPPALATFEHLRKRFGASLKMIDNLVDQKTGLLRVNNARKYLYALGVSKPEVEKLLATSSDPGWTWHVMDRMAAEMAKKGGHDAIETSREYFALRPEATRAPLIKPLPVALQRFAGHPGEFTSANYRERYFPGHNYEKVVDPNQPAKEIPLLGARNPHVLEQAPFKIPSSKVDEFEKAFEGMLKTSASSITANKAFEELGKIYGGGQNIPQAIQDIMTVHVPATGTARTVAQKAAESIKGLVNLPKLGIVGTTPIHIFNILSLLMARAPEQIPIAALHFAKIMRAGGDEAKRFEAMLPAIERGIDVATHEKGGPLLSRLPLNRATWNWDTAAKQALSDKYVSQGMKPLEAGNRASNELVNYANRSPLTGLLQWFMPFATFAEGGAKAVLGATAKQPALVELENRLLGGRFLGGGNSKTDTTLYQPPANVGRGLPTYLRSKTSDLVKLPLALGAEALPGGKQFSKWALSGRTPLGTAADIVTSPVPYLRDVLDLIPVHNGKTLRGYAPDTFGQQALFSSTGVSLPHKPKANALAPPSINPLLPSAPTAPAQTTQPSAGNPLLSP